MCIETSQSLSRRIGNAQGDEIGIKLNRREDVILLIQSDADNVGPTKIFTFSKDDMQALVVFEMMFNNVVNYYRSYAKNYGKKTNNSDICPGVFMKDSFGNRLVADIIVGEGIQISIKHNETQSGVEYLFSKNDSVGLTQFKNDLTAAAKNCAQKLPAIPISASGSNPQPE
ncbi:MAG: hypothetical protein M0R17_03400 [Candidatus Omnitrophica bacterium]|jgi:hypothetical protein|nr:hypothetical protein [Candidatus Omnitrophota bacterium]